jgi:hypothetical protein
MKREKRLTKKERKALAGPRPAQAAAHQHRHIHCIACGKHLDDEMFDDPATATWLTCQHHSQFPSCIACRDKSQALLDEHDRSGQPVRTAAAWH